MFFASSIFRNNFFTFRNDNLHMDGSKEIWNSNKSNLNKVSQSFVDYLIMILFSQQSGNNWGAQDQLQLGRKTQSNNEMKT